MGWLSNFLKSVSDRMGERPKKCHKMKAENYFSNQLIRNRESINMVRKPSVQEFTGKISSAVCRGEHSAVHVQNRSGPIM